MTETFFEEMKRYVRFDETDGAALRALAPFAAPHFRAITDDFYARLAAHDKAHAVFSGPEQVERLKVTLCSWMALLLSGPWDEAYFQRRGRIGRMHIQIALPQRYMFSAMNVLRVSLQDRAREAFTDGEARRTIVVALAKIVDLELAIMLESYREAFVEQMNEAERHKKELVAHQSAEHLGFIAHELRNPLGTARLGLSLLRKKSEGGNAVVERIDRALGRLQDLIDNTLTQSRLDQITVPRYEHLSAATVLNEAMVESIPDAEARGISILIDMTVDVRVDADPRLLRSAVTNLLRNAVKFTRSGGTVVMRGCAAAVLDGNVRFVVEDECGGLPDSAVDDLFTPFVQRDADRSGFGLGLAIARQAIAAHRGSIRVRNLPGKGCEFTIELPCKAPSPTAMA